MTTDKSPAQQAAEEWENADRPGRGMQQFDYWNGAHYGFLAGWSAGRKDLVERAEANAHETIHKGGLRHDYAIDIDKLEKLAGE